MTVEFALKLEPEPCHAMNTRSKSHIRKEPPTWEEWNKALINDCEMKGGKHYKGRAECFIDVIAMFDIIHKHNCKCIDRAAAHDNSIRIISPTITGSAVGDTEFDFWSNAPMRKIQKLLNDRNDDLQEGQDLHRIIQTIKPYALYTGDVDWDVDL